MIYDSPNASMNVIPDLIRDNIVQPFFVRHFLFYVALVWVYFGDVIFSTKNIAPRLIAYPGNIDGTDVLK